MALVRHLVAGIKLMMVDVPYQVVDGVNSWAFGTLNFINTVLYISLGSKISTLL